MKLLIFAGALRADSANKKLAREALRLAQEIGAEGEFIDLKDYPMPLYDGDIETGTGIPQTTKDLGEKVLAADALVIATPEYNASMPAVLKNTIDWLSRLRPMPLNNKPLLLLAASPGALGGIRVLWHARQPLEALNMHVFPGMMGLGDAYNAFDADGRLKDEKNRTRLHDTLTNFLKHVQG